MRDLKISASEACNLLSVSIRSYHQWKSKGPKPVKDLGLRRKLHKMAVKDPGFGYRRITHKLQSEGLKINRKKVLRVMREERILVRKKARFKPVTTQSEHGLKVYPNRIKNLKIARPNQVWVTDLTYVPIGNKFAYLCVIMDLCSRKAIAHHISHRIDSQLTLTTLRKAFKARKTQSLKGLIIHSDRGVQYASKAYTQELLKKSILISMSRKANPYDNAHMESFMKTLKTEEINIKEYQTLQEAKDSTGKFINYYNQQRPHSAINYQTPNQHEKNHKDLNKTPKPNVVVLPVQD